MSKKVSEMTLAEANAFIRAEAKAMVTRINAPLEALYRVELDYLMGPIWEAQKEMMEGFADESPNEQLKAREAFAIAGGRGLAESIAVHFTTSIVPRIRADYVITNICPGCDDVKDCVNYIRLKAAAEGRDPTPDLPEEVREFIENMKASGAKVHIGGLSEAAPLETLLRLLRGRKDEEEEKNTLAV